MKVLLCNDVEKLGWFGDIVEVKTGYARNYLLPQRIAIVPTQANIKSLEDEKVDRSRKRKIAVERLAQTAERVDGAEAVIAAKANEQGHLFGSVSGKDIVANLREQGFEVPDNCVAAGEHIKDVGEHSVLLKFSSELTVTVKVVVVSQDGDAEVADGSLDQDNQ
ncbi:MAG: 50S ribosomal protein L9 [Planctomycetes bacterium]|nr:50S ribosomal protein L9 [Planctomycetota bacterium]